VSGCVGDAPQVNATVNRVAINGSDRIIGELDVNESGQMAGRCLVSRTSALLCVYQNQAKRVGFIDPGVAAMSEL